MTPDLCGDQAFVVQLESGEELVARLARRFMPRIKTESEVRRSHFLAC